MSSATRGIEHKRIHASAHMHALVRLLQEVLEVLGPKMECV